MNKYGSDHSSANTKICLTDRELDVLRLMDAGLSNQEIADQLTLSYNTVTWYVKQIFNKLGVNWRGQAVAAARAQGLLTETREVKTQGCVNMLTDREMDVIRLMDAGLSNQAIADQLTLSYNTVTGYVKQIFRKLNVTRRIQAVAVARATQPAIAEEQRGYVKELQMLLATQLSIAAREAEVNHSRFLAGQSQIALSANNIDLALALALEANNISDPPGQAQTALSEAAYAPGGTIRRYSGHDGEVWGVALSADGQKMLSSSEDGTIILWDVATGESIHHLEGHTDGVWRVAISPDGCFGLSASHDMSVIYWELEKGEVVYRFTDLGRINDVEISPDGRIGVSCSGSSMFSSEDQEDNSIRFWDLQTGEEIRQLSFSHGVTDIAFSPDGTQLAANIVDEGMALLDIKTGEVLLRAGLGVKHLFAVAFSPDGRFVIIGGDHPSRPVSWWAPIKIDLETGEEIPFEDSHANNSLTALDISPDGRRVISSAGDLVLAWDIETGKLIQKIAGFAAWDIEYLPDGRAAVAAVRDDNILRLVALESGALAAGARFPVQPAAVLSTEYSPDGESVFISSWVEDQLEVYDLSSGRAIQRFNGNVPIPDSAWKMAYSSDGNYGLTANRTDHSISYWNIETSEEIFRLDLEDGSIYSVDFHPGAQYGLAGGTIGDGEGFPLVYWDLTTGEPAWVVDPAFEYAILGVAISPNGDIALSGSQAGVDMWHLQDGSHLMNLDGHTSIVWDLAFIDAQTALSASQDGTMILWNLQTGTAIRSFVGHSQGIKQIALSPDHRLVASVSRDGTVILWDVATGEPLRRYYGHPDQGRTVTYSPDGRELISGGQLGEIFRWRVDEDLETLLAWVAANRWVRELSCAERQVYHIEPLCETGN